MPDAPKANEPITPQSGTKAGDFYLPGHPVPPGLRPTAWVNSPVMTLERMSSKNFDSDIMEKVQRELDKAYVRSFSKPTTDLPEGQRPWLLVVNDEFDMLMPGLKSYGDLTLQPTCDVLVVDDSDKRLKAVGAVIVGKVLAYFDTKKPERRKR